MLADKLFDTFKGREDIFAKEFGGGFSPTSRPLSATDVETYHLGKQRCLGFYLLTPESKCWVSAVDFDEKSEPDWKKHAIDVWAWCTSAGLETLIEQSQSGTGAHVWMFFDQPADAWLVRSFWRWVSRATSITFREIFPKQDRLAGKGLGNLIRYPLWNQSAFVDDEWSRLDPVLAIEQITRYSPDVLTELAARAHVVLDADPSLIVQDDCGELPARVASAIGSGLAKKRWTGDGSGLADQSRSGMAFSLAMELIRKYIPTHEIEIGIKHWLIKHGAESKADRQDWIKHTVAKAYDYVIDKVEKPSTSESTMRDCVHLYIDAIEKGEVQHCVSGIRELDASIDGVAKGELCMIAARPSHGKSALAIQWADHAAANGTTCLFISEEMSKKLLGQRNLQRITGLPQDEWVQENVDPLRSDTDGHYLKRKNIHVVEQCFTIDRAEEVIDQYCGMYGVELVVVDYLQLLKSRGQKRNEQVADVSIRLKHCCNRNDIAMLCVAQLNRELDYRDDRAPKMSDLGDSGQLERDADLIMILDWPFMTNSEQPEDMYLMHMLKRRNGAIRTRKVVTIYDPKRQIFG